MQELSCAEGQKPPDKLIRGVTNRNRQLLWSEFFLSRINKLLFSTAEELAVNEPKHLRSQITAAADFGITLQQF